MTKKPEMVYDVAAAVPCCKNEENSPTKAGCATVEKVVVMLLQEAQTGLLAPIPTEKREEQATNHFLLFSIVNAFSNQASHPPIQISQLITQELTCLLLQSTVPEITGCSCRVASVISPQHLVTSSRRAKFSRG